MYVVRPEDPSSPDELYHSILDFHPYVGTGLLRAAVPGDFWKGSVDETEQYGVYKILAYEELKKLPLFEWDQLFNAAKKGKKA